MSWSLVLEGLGNISNVAATGLAAYSIVITIKEYNRIKKTEQEQMLSAQQMLWYNEIALQDIVKALNVFIEHSNQTIHDISYDKPIDNEKGKILYSKIAEECSVINERLMGMKIFDYQLYRKCDRVLQEILDQYANIVESLVEKRYSLYAELSSIQKCKVEIMAFLYEYGKRLTNS
ncbi:MAG: hypothetical protein NC347_03280 [Clostridium sp.]|nr:hypothetical protein [Clostridium sp.]